MSIYRQTKSESTSLQRAISLIAWAQSQLEKGGGAYEAQPFLDEAKDILRTLKHNAARGIHHNPPLTVFGMNPPFHARPVRRSFEEEAGTQLKIYVVGQIAEYLHCIRYTHIEDGEDYEHIFETEKTQALAVEGKGIHRSVLLTGPDDIWDNY